MDNLQPNLKLREKDRRGWWTGAKCKNGRWLIIGSRGSITVTLQSRPTSHTTSSVTLFVPVEALLNSSAIRTKPSPPLACLSKRSANTCLHNNLLTHWLYSIFAIPRRPLLGLRAAPSTQLSSTHCSSTRLFTCSHHTSIPFRGCAAADDHLFLHRAPSKFTQPTTGAATLHFSAIRFLNSCARLSCNRARFYQQVAQQFYFQNLHFELSQQTISFVYRQMIVYIFEVINKRAAAICHCEFFLWDKQIVQNYSFFVIIKVWPWNGLWLHPFLQTGKMYIIHDHEYYERRAPQPDLGLIKNVQRFIWDREKRKFLDKTFREWGKILYWQFSNWIISKWCIEFF